MTPDFFLVLGEEVLGDPKLLGAFEKEHQAVEALNALSLFNGLNLMLCSGSIMEGIKVIRGTLKSEISHPRVKKNLMMGYRKYLEHECYRMKLGLYEAGRMYMDTLKGRFQ